MLSITARSICTAIPILAAALVLAPGASADSGNAKVRAKHLSAAQRDHAKKTPPGLIARLAKPHPGAESRGKQDERPEPRGPEQRFPGEGDHAGSTVIGDADGSTSASGVPQDAAWTGSYWTNPNRQIGRLYFDVMPGAGVSWTWCSGTVVNSENRSLVVTAGHCVYTPDPDRDGVVESNAFWHENYVFCPGYENGTATENGCRLGAWNGRGAVTTPGWADSQSLRDDMAVVLLEADPSKGTIADYVGTQGITFNQSSWIGDTRRSFGYPATDSRWPSYTYSGEDLIYCRDADTYSTGVHTIDCTMTGGSSGGPWLTHVESNWRGYVNSVNSFKPSGKTMSGPYFGNAELDVYQYSRNL